MLSRPREFVDYVNTILMNPLERILKAFPKLRSAACIDHRSAIVKELIDGVVELGTYRNRSLHWPTAYNEARDFDMLMNLIGVLCGGRLKGVAVGPHLSGNGVTY